MAEEEKPQTPEQPNAVNITENTTQDTVNSKIEKLEQRKNELIESIKKAYRRIRYKKYEQKALEPFLEKTKDVQISPLRKIKRSLEFRISTAAYTPKMEREILKKMKEVDTELEKVKEVEKARRKAKYVVQDIIDAENDIKKIEEELKVIREELKKHYDSVRAVQRASRKPNATHAPQERNAEEDRVALGDIALVEKEEI